MIKKNCVVLVLGAGASAPYGFPIGSGLVDAILSTQGRSAVYQPFLELTAAKRYTREQVAEFCQLLRMSGWNSIDRFLQHRSDLQALGKALIAFHLRPFEDPTVLAAGGDNRWYRYLYNDILRPSSPEQFAQNRLSVITYNYDRSLEQFFTEALRSGFNLKADDAWSFAHRIPVIHVHGSFGGLPPKGRNPCSYDTSRSDLLGTAARLHIISDDIKASGVLETCRGVLKAATHIVFLGFGYDSVNMERLELGQLRQSPQYSGTAFGLEEGEVAVAVRRHFDKLGGISTAAADVDCLGFLRRYREKFE